jgi:hypothetical protein
VNFQDRDWIELDLPLVLDIGHVIEVVSIDHARSDSLKQRIAAFQNVEAFNGAKIATQNKPDHSWRHEAILDSDQRATVKIQAVNCGETQVAGLANGSTRAGFQIHHADPIAEGGDVKQTQVRRERNTIRKLEFSGKALQFARSSFEIPDGSSTSIGEIDAAIRR